MPLVKVPKPTLTQKLKRFLLFDLLQGTALLFAGFAHYQQEQENRSLCLADAAEVLGELIRSHIARLNLIDKRTHGSAEVRAALGKTLEVGDQFEGLRAYGLFLDAE